MAKHSRSCCCCLPVRFGVFAFAIAGIIVGLALFISGVFAANKLNGHLSPRNKLAVYLHLFIYLLLANLCVFGLYGAIHKRRKLIVLFFSMLTAHLLISFASGVFALYSLFHLDPSETMEKCMQAATDVFTKNICNQGVVAMQGASVTILSIIWLNQIYGCFVVNSYIKELVEYDQRTNPLTGPPTP